MWNLYFTQKTENHEKANTQLSSRAELSPASTNKPLEILTGLQKAFDFRELPQGRKEGTYENQRPNSL